MISILQSLLYVGEHFGRQREPLSHRLVQYINMLIIQPQDIFHRETFEGGLHSLDHVKITFLELGSLLCSSYQRGLL
jgi:hypothetical protein